ncbi:MAG: hypothetical protein WAR79_14160 [Melioribacteraceae bacterium]
MKDFPVLFKKQLDAVIEFIESLNPKIILVINDKASEIYKDSVLFKTSFDIELGTYKHPKLGIPVFLSGMLSGQRALDNHSNERLIWQIKRV